MTDKQPYPLRIARPVRDLAKTTEMYCRGLGLKVLGRFENHAGFDGVMLGEPGASYHFEFTYCRGDPVIPVSTHEDLAVFYIANDLKWRDACDAMKSAGFKQVASFNPYWEQRGRTYMDNDGYRIVLQNAEWVTDPASC